MTTTIESRTYLPEEEVAGRFADIVNAASSQEATPRLVVGDKAVELTPGMADVLVRVAQAMQQGLAVTVAPQNTRLTTQEAADMLGISRSTLVRMLEAGEIPFEKVRRHRRLYLSDVLEFQKRQRRAADEALSDMVADAQAMGAYDNDPAEVREALAAVRAEK
jgi:toxin-antitoxin system, antitoxin component, merR family